LKDCNYTTCQHNAASSSRLKRFGLKCLHKPGCIIESPNTTAILRNSASDINYNVKRLTDDELKYCLFKEKRKTGQAKLQAEAKRRGLIEKKGGP